MDITPNEFMEVIYGFIRFAYNEMQTECWIKRRYDFRNQFNLINYEFILLDDEITFPQMMERFDGNLENTLTQIFCRELTCVDWFDAYYYYTYPEKFANRQTYRESTYSNISNLLINWIFNKRDDELFAELNDILFMDISLK